MKFFKPHEFECRCGKCGLGFDNMNPGLLSFLDQLRGRCGFPIHITSAIRCVDHNAFVGGGHNSAHLDGCAVDIAVDGLHDNYWRYELILNSMALGCQRIGIGDDFIHLDVANDEHHPFPRMWVYI